MEPRPAVRDRGTLRLALLAMAFETWFVLALVVLHLLRRDLPPGRTMISQYAVGPYGALMASAFVALALALLMLVLGLLRDGPRSWAARIAEVLLGIAVVGLVISAAFPMDIRPPRTLSGKLHDISFLVNVTSSLLASALLSASFGSDPRWRPLRGAALAMVAAQVAAFVAQIVTIVTRNHWGVANRLFVLTMVIWFFAVALRLRVVALDRVLVTAPLRS